MKKNGFGFIATFITLALSGGAATATGCGGVATSSLCEDICACQRCTSNDLKACQDQGEKAADQADAAGCSSQFQDAVTCASAHITCNKDQAVVAKACDAEQDALTKCSSTISVLGKNACERAADVAVAKIEGCGGTVNTSTGSGTTVECTPALSALVACQTACIDAADCAVVVSDSGQKPTDEQVKAFADCVTTCQ